MGSAELRTRLIAERLHLQTVRNALMRRGTRRGTASGQKNRLRSANSLLVREQHVIGASAVAEMLVNIDDRLGCGLLCGCVIAHGRAGERECRSPEELSAVHADSLDWGSPGVYGPVLDFPPHQTFLGGRT